MKYYDIIGDIHGQAEKLNCLLDKLGYKKTDGIYRHSNAIAVFVGDFIDRGPHQRQVIKIVRSMVENGHARAVMGNHEFNAICYHTEDPDQKGQFLRSHTEKNSLQHQSFLNEFPLGHKDTQEVIEWFMSLPICMELKTSNQQMPSIRIVHACWDQPLIDWLVQQDNKAQLNKRLLVAAAREGSKAFAAIETLLKGPEIPLPRGCCFKDKDGINRYHIRYKWWGRKMHTYKEAAVVPESEKQHIPDNPLPETFKDSAYATNAAPVFFGHYWLTGKPKVLADNAVCLDYSAGKQGPLIAYRWDNRSNYNKYRLLEEHFVISD